MWEVFLFVNPLGSYCLKTERTILEFVKKHNIQAHFNFIAITNMENVNDILENVFDNTTDLELRNEITIAAYDAALTYKAAACQGKKKARELLMSIQYAFNELNREYNNDLVKEITTKLNIDFKELIADKECDLVNSSFQADQLLAREMNVTHTPSTVIFNYDANDSNGLLIDNCQSSDELIAILLDLYQQNNSNLLEQNIIDLSFYQN
ncbi:dithiol-disulfide isomerase [Companilactobacillus sp. RD055328]|uniref:DsbA family protein n=1 Tax=Companilactobacillus sp. RD055328 TaxID=2916634 RepID=UPI001FC8B197|nr:DsbA family protein [Companilactobacillus sp. RD055328]GKQ43085.1 dithiol-disulfide isomerase [Companilactobacillus sp. RD055328]